MLLEELVSPVVTCHDNATLRDVQKVLARGSPVAVRFQDHWCLLLPQKAINYPNTRLVVDLPLINPPILSPTAPLAEAAEALANSPCPYGLVLKEKKLLGHVSLKQVLTEITKKVRHAAQMGETLSQILLQARALVWRYWIPQEVIKSKGKTAPKTLQGLEIHGPMEDLLGYSLGDFRTQPNLWHQNIHPKDKTRVIGTFFSLFKGRKNCTLEYRFLHKNGKWVCLRDQVQTEHDHRGKLIAFTGVLTDVTEEMEQRRLEDLVHQIHRVLSRRNHGEALEKAYALLGEHLPIDTILLWTISPKGIGFNPQWIREGYQEKIQALAQEIRRLYSSVWKSTRLQWSFKKVLEEGKPEYIPDLTRLHSPAARIVAKYSFMSAFVFPLQRDGEERRVLGLVSRHKNALNERQRHSLEDLFLTFSSVTRAQHYEKKLTELNATLEERVLQRTFEFQTLYELTKKFGYTLSYDELCRLVVSGLRDVMNFDLAATLLVTDQVIDLTVYPSRPLTPKVLDEVKKRLLHTLPQKLRNQKTIIKTRELFPQEHPPVKLLSSTFQVHLPTNPERGIQGTILIGSEKKNAFSSKQIELLSTVVNQASIAVQRLREFLTTQEQRLETIVETFPEGIALLDKDLKIALCNPTATQYLGLLGCAGLGDHLERLGDIPAKDLLDPALSESWKEIKGPNGRTFEVRSCPVNITSRQDHWILIIRDVTSIRESDMKVRSALEGTVYALASAIDRRDPYTAGHQKQVAELAKSIATEMGLPPKLIHGIHIGALVHDLGKISIPSEILVKPGRLKDFEFALIKQHPVEGYTILKDIDFPWPIAQMVLQHHERLDGSGYPNGLKDQEIIIEAKIIAVADVVEAMSSHRPYRPALGIEVALKEIDDNKGRFYDPQAVEACITLFRKRNFRFKN